MPPELLRFDIIMGCAALGVAAFTIGLVLMFEMSYRRKDAILRGIIEADKGAKPKAADHVRRRRNGNSAFALPRAKRRSRT